MAGHKLWVLQDMQQVTRSYKSSNIDNFGLRFVNIFLCSHKEFLKLTPNCFITRRLRLCNRE
eukprot:5118428-Amphidinium_carterae.1